MRRILALVVVAALMMSAGCGGSGDPGTAATPTPTTVMALNRTDFSTWVPSALLREGTFHAVVTTTDEDGRTTVRSDLRLTSAGADLSASNDLGLSVLRISGKLYGKGKGLTEDPARPWKAWDPEVATADPLDSLTGAQLKLQAAPALTHQVLVGTAYATKFGSAAGTPVDGVPTTQYTITIDAEKAAAARTLGEYLTTEVVTAQKIKEITMIVLVDQDNLPRRLDFTLGAAKVSAQFSKFGEPVAIAAPPAAQIDS